MKYWLEGILEKTDRDVQCCKCRVWSLPPDHVFCEFALVGGGMPSPSDLHPEPTGNWMCSSCASMTLT